MTVCLWCFKGHPDLSEETRFKFFQHRRSQKLLRKEITAILGCLMVNDLYESADWR